MRILCISAHPDDIEFGCAGSVARWVDEKNEVTYVIVTDGSTGTEDAELAGPKLAEIRVEEALNAAKIAGVEDVEFLRYRDGYVEYTMELRRDLARVYRKYRPERLIAMDPQSLPGGWFINHPDHRAVGQATLDVSLTAGTTIGHFPELAEEGLQPWRGLKEIFVTGPAGGETHVDISDYIDIKIRALQCHVSQVGHWDVGSAVRQWTAEAGRKYGVAHAETFHVIRPLPTGEENPSPEA